MHGRWPPGQEWRHREAERERSPVIVTQGLQRERENGVAHTREYTFMVGGGYHGTVRDWQIRPWVGYEGLVNRSVRYGAMRLQQIGGNRVTGSQQIGGQPNWNLKGMKFACRYELPGGR